MSLALDMKFLITRLEEWSLTVNYAQQEVTGLKKSFTDASIKMVHESAIRIVHNMCCTAFTM